MEMPAMSLTSEMAAPEEPGEWSSPYVDSPPAAAAAVAPEPAPPVMSDMAPAAYAPLVMPAMYALPGAPAVYAPLALPAVYAPHAAFAVPAPSAEREM